MGDIEKVDQQLEKWAEYYNKGEFEALGKLYTEDCKLLPSGAPSAVGKKAVVALLEKFPESGVTVFEKHDQEIIQLSADAIVSCGAWAMKWTATNERRTFKDCLMWKKVNGEWLIFRDTYTFNN